MSSPTSQRRSEVMVLLFFLAIASTALWMGMSIFSQVFWYSNAPVAIWLWALGFVYGANVTIILTTICIIAAIEERVGILSRVRRRLGL